MAHHENVGGAYEMTVQDVDVEYGIRVGPLLFVQQLAAKKMDQVV